MLKKIIILTGILAIYGCGGGGGGSDSPTPKKESVVVSVEEIKTMAKIEEAESYTVEEDFKLTSDLVVKGTLIIK